LLSFIFKNYWDQGSSEGLTGQSVNQVRRIKCIRIILINKITELY
jgi:hypothetical protein